MVKSKKELLVEATLKGDDFSDLVNLASYVLNNALVIIGNSYNILAYSKTFTVNDIAWVNATKRGFITLEFGATLNNWNQHTDPTKSIDCVTVTEISKYTRRFFKLIYKNKLMGYLNVTDVNDCLDEVDESLYQFVSELLAKEIAYNYRDYSNRPAKIEDILFELSNESFINKLHFIDRISSCHINIQTKFQVACIDLNNFTSFNANEDTFKNEILSFFPNGHLIINNQLLIILCDIENISTNPFNTKLESYLKKKNLVMGVSDSFHDLYDYKIFENEAKSSINYRNFLTNQSHIIFYERVKQYDLFSHFTPNQLTYYCNQKLYSLYLHEKNEKTEYIKTLRIYLECNHSVKDTAELLFIHRNTVNYRIQKIKELLDMEISDQSLTNELLFSCQILQILDHN